MSCPCGRCTAAGRPLAFEDCCGRYLADWQGAPAPDAPSLMRSRYTAYVRCDADYLRATWHPSTRPPQIDPDAATRWLGLDLISSRSIDDTHAEVEFVARWRQAGRGQRMRERSRFVREGGRWYYLDGDVA